MRRNLRPDDLGGFLDRPLVAIVATRRSDGTTMLSPVWQEWSADGFTFVTFLGDAKLIDIQRDLQVSMVVAEDEPPYRGIEVRGHALIVDENGPTVLRRLANRYLVGRDIDAYMDKIFKWMEEVGHGGIVVIRVAPGLLRVGTTLMRPGDTEQ